MRHRARRALVAGWALLLPACEPPAPEDPSLSEHVVPLLSATCSFSTCHGGSAEPPPGFVRLGPSSRLSPAELRARLVDQPADAHPALRLVVPGDPDASFLMRKVEGRFEDLPCWPSGCGERMPQRSGSLSEQQVLTLRNWIAQGAKEN